MQSAQDGPLWQERLDSIDWKEIYEGMADFFQDDPVPNLRPQILPPEITHLSLEDQVKVLKRSQALMSAQYKEMLNVYKTHFETFPAKQKGLKQQCNDILKVIDFAVEERNAYLCRQCVNNCAYFIFTPCKHMVCESCGNDSVCPLCRTFREKIKLFAV